MWWVLVMLPLLAHAMQALASTNAINFVDNDVCEKPFVCKSAIQCSIWYNELNAFPPKPCLNFEGYVGLCCPDIVQIKRKYNISILVILNKSYQTYYLFL